jgi:hypothetical protein
MAVFQIAKIQVRRGDARQTGIPHLDAGEFGWAIAGTDPNSTIPELYIGNGSLSEGAAVEGVTRLLTEYDTFSGVLNAINAINGYTYKGHSSSTLSNIQPRTVQSKLDDFVNVLDYTEHDVNGLPVLIGAAVQIAIDSLYSTFSPENGVTLHIPPGTFNFNSTLLIPPNVTLLGAGKGKTIFNLLKTATEPLLQFCDSQKNVFEDNNNQIISSGRPENIIISGITFRHDPESDNASVQQLIKADCSKQSMIVNCEFIGVYAASAESINLKNCGIEIRGLPGIDATDSPYLSDGLIIDNNTFSYLYYGVKSQYDIRDTTISNNKFNHLYQGVLHGDFIAINSITGPVRTKLHSNKFYKVEHEGFYVGNSPVPTNHISSFNTFNLVGNNSWTRDDGDSYAITPVINFLSTGNQSIGDYSTRFTSVNEVTTSTISVHSAPIGGKVYTDLNAVYTNPLDTTISTSTVTLVRFPYSAPETLINLQYSIYNAGANVARKGNMTINAGTISTGVDATIVDHFSYIGSGVNADGGVTFSVSLSTVTNTIDLQYLCIQSGNTITYKYSQLQ